MLNEYGFHFIEAREEWMNIITEATIPDSKIDDISCMQLLDLLEELS